MAVPPFVQASTGTPVLTGTGTVSLTGATGGNILFLHILERGTPGQQTRSAYTNVSALDGTANAITTILSGSVGNPATDSHYIYVCRATASGTCSLDLTVGASGFDLYARWYEFSGGSDGATLATVLENSAGDGIKKQELNTNTTIADANVTTSDVDRLALNFVALAGDQALAAFTSMTGGTWAEAVAEYRDATGATGTLQLQTASMPSAATIQFGTQTISSAAWACMGTALIPGPEVSGRTFKRFTGPAQLSGTASTLYTVPTGMRAVIRHIHVSNPSGSPVDLSLSIGADAAGTRVFDDYEIASEEVRRFFGPYTLEAGETIQAFAGTAATLVLTASGYEEPV